VNLLERLHQLWDRLLGYRQEWLEVAIELAIIWIVVYAVVRFLRGTRGARVIKGLALVLVIATLTFQVIAVDNALSRLQFLYRNFLTFITLAMVIVFQPELRRALTRLGETRLFPVTRMRRSHLIEQIVASVAYMSKNKIGALIAIEREVGLAGLTESGTPLDARISRELLNTIFWPGSALHDLGMVVRGDRVVAAGVQFPMAEGEHYSSELGSRHRAAIGLSQECDALVIVVSEETGTISLAERGQMVRNLSPEALRSELTRGLGKTPLTVESNGEKIDVDPREAA
jgi:diadenylate cyclase